MAELTTPKSSSAKVITRRMWAVMAALGLTGQIAWGVENMWFNKFVYDKITPDPRPVAWMVAVSAITATLTTLLMGTLSDRTRTRWGRRKPFILLGYILWGISTAVFPTVAYIKTTSLAVLMVVLADAVMTFFGSTANDANFSAWTADIASSSTRGRVEGVLQVSTYLAQVLVMVAAGLVIDSVGYFYFFYILGAIVLLVGLVAGSLLNEPEETLEPHKNSLWHEFIELFQFTTLKENKVLFMLLAFVMVSSIGNQVSMPYLLVYLSGYLGMTNQQFSIVGGAVMVGGALVAIPFGFLADRWNRRTMIIVTVVVSALGEVALSFMRSLPLIALFAFVWQGFLVAYGIAAGAWMKDLLPEENRGKFLGVRMIFWIAIPMVIGPFIGSTLIQHFGIPTVSNGESGFIPVPLIFQVDAVIAMLSLLVMTRIQKKDALPPSHTQAPSSGE